MKILTDTNVFIDFWNNPTEQITKVFAEEDIVICGIVRAELLHGATSSKNLKKITELLNIFDEVNFENMDWQILGEQLYCLRKKGISVPISDAIIASIAIKHDIPVWSQDRHFELIKGALNGLRLYEG